MSENRKGNFKLKVIVLFTFITSFLLCTGFSFSDLFTKAFEEKRTGKYQYYIDACKDLRKKEVDKNKPADNTYIILYDNVIFEKELSKSEMQKIANGKPIAEYLVCICDKYDVKNKNDTETKKGVKFYICKVSKDDFRDVVKNEIKEAKGDSSKKDISDAITAAGVGASGGAGTGATIGSIVPGIGTAIGAIVGAGVGTLVGVAVDANNKFIDEDMEIDEVVMKLSDEDYNKNYSEYASIYKPSIKEVKQEKLSDYLDKNGLASANAIIKKYK